MSTKVLMIIPDLPAAVGSGGQVRAWHFLRELCRTKEVLACVLPAKSNGCVDASQLGPKVTILQPGGGVGDFRLGGGIQRILRPLKALLNPAGDGGAVLLNAGRANNVDRAQAVGGQAFTSSHRIYALILRKYAKALSSRLEPYGTMLRRSAWLQLLPLIRRHYADSTPDIIWVEHSYLFPLALEMKNNFPSARIICNAHNVETALHASMAANTFPSSAREWVLIEGSIVQHWERRMMNEAESVICCSEPDAKRFEDLVGTHAATVKVIPNGVDTEYFRVCAPSSSRPQLLFAGTAGYAPNDDAVDWLIRDIFPKVLESIPDCQLVLAGRSAEKCWGHLRKGCRNLEIHADVPDMRPLIAEASICLVPLRSGSGTRLKILEAMSSGRALVSTSIGAEGIEGENGKHWLIADSADQFVDSILGLLRNDTMRQQLELSGRALAADRYCWTSLTTHVHD